MMDTMKDALTLNHGYANQFANMLKQPVKQSWLPTRAIHGGLGLVDAFNAWDAPDPTTLEGALEYGSMPAKAVVGLGQGMVDVLKGAMDNPNDSMKMLDLASMVAGGGFGASKLAGVPKGALGANVWQGGPHKYGPEGASESLKHMSKGEGAQAYGWGRYDAENKVVGQEYKDQLSGLNNSAIARELERHGGDIDASIDAMTTKLNNLKAIPDGQDGLNIARRDGQVKISEAKLAGLSALKRGDQLDDGYLYKHDLPDEDIARYLDWDAPLSEQPESVRAALGDLIGDYEVKGPTGGKRLQFDDSALMRPDGGDTLPNEITGQEIYQRMMQDAGGSNRQAASEALGRAGIPGLKYFDGMSRKPGASSLTTTTLDARIQSLEADLKTGLGQPEVMKRKLASLKAERAKHDEANRTRNYVTWDQEVLDRMKLLERNNEDMTKALMQK